MNTAPVLVFSLATQLQIAPGEVRAARPVLIPGSGRGPSGEGGSTSNAFSIAASPQDEVKVQMEPPGEIAVYQFVNQQGALILQVPPQPVLNLARQISQELAQEAATEESAAIGGKDHGR
jgi:hypothetical protein